MRAVLSVSDKTGIDPFARGLVALGAEVVSTGGTLAALRGAGIPATAVADVTGFPEILGGRVKTLHPRIHGGILARPDEPSHAEELATHAIAPFGLVAVNLYPFAATVAMAGVSEAAAVEQIDIGGPAMLRAAAKNFGSVVPLCDPADFEPILAALGGGGLDGEGRRALAAKAFAHTAAYDAAVAAWLLGESPTWPDELTVAGRKTLDLRYGENPHQRAAAYVRFVPGAAPSGVLAAEQVTGKALSYNNLLDADAAWAAVARFAEPAVAIVKHTIPCGLALRGELAAAFAAALAGDPVSAFGGIVAANRPIDGTTAEAIADRFYEVIVAPGFDEEALETLGRKKALRLLRMPDGLAAGPRPPEVRSILGGLLVQEPDDLPAEPSAWRTISRRAPTGAERDDLRFAWEAVRAVKSNGIVLAKGRALVGVGSGQPNRVESVRLALRGAGERAAGSVLASDAFFPFVDGVEAAVRAGVTAIVQPGGSVRDAEVVAAADAAGLAMLVTGVRHFRH
ncbi:MAG: bifunctional phosphoribosylaminoimidazolecarboxamide formyltransferase/IMP cyclohydrolase [Chloroflexia bacterium]|nr:bifunctional phosphoribosylaminoimidazolecarboxamide formyltransferase/IMP cyclohydrolase [Chloroflexia bacterium]